MTKSNRLSEYERGVIARAEAWEYAHLMQTGHAHLRERELRGFIREHKRAPRRNAARASRKREGVAA